MLTSKKVFSLLRLGGLPLVMSLVLILAIGASSVQAQSVDTLGVRAAKLFVKLTNNAVQDSVQMSNFSLLVGDTLASAAAGGHSDSVRISFAGGKFLFGQTKPYPVVVNGAVIADSARVNAAGTSLFIKITGPVSGSFDTLTISNVYIKGNTASVAYSDSTGVDSLAFAVGSTATTFTAGAHNGNNITLLPAPIYTIASSVLAATTATAGTAFNAGTLNCTDRWGNVPYDKSTAVTIAPLLNGTTTAGNGLLGVPASTKAATTGHPGTCTQAWAAQTYPKAEVIQLKYTAAGNSITSAALTVSPGAAAFIGAALVATYSDNFTVDGSTQYTLTVTDANFNPVAPTGVTWAENTPHGGVGGSGTTSSGQITAAFTPSKFFVGPDTLLFTAGTATLLRPIVIGAGAFGGVIVDYASTASGSATTEQIGAGQTVYVRGFLRDTYGNPIDATSASQVAFTISGKSGKNTLLGANSLTSSITQPGYPNTNKIAVGIAAPYNVSTNVRALTDSVLASIGGYSNTITIQNRSDVPAVVKLVQSVAGDSSLIVSNYSNFTTYSDTVWDQYSNLVTAPATSVKIAPLYSAYKMIFATVNGNAGFTRSADTTFADTLYPSAGIINRTVSSTKKAGLDTLKTWAAVNPSVAKAAPLWIAPATYAKVALIPHTDTTAIAGKVEVFKVEKQDTYGNHIDWGFSGGQARGNIPNAVKPIPSQILADSTSLVADTVSTGHNRGGKFVKSTITGTAGIASVGGSLNLTAKFTPYTVTADTQKIYVSLTGFNDTVQVRSISTGALASFSVTIAAADSLKNAGDSVKVVVTAFDAANNQIYSYGDGAQAFGVPNTTAPAIATKDSTWYFSYANTRGQYVKSTGASIPDTVFVSGVATLYLHKFAAENVYNTVSATMGSITATSAKGSKFIPLTSAGQTTWSVTLSDTVTVNSAFNYVITPRDMYYNINTTATNFGTISSNQGVNFDGGVNPKIFIGPTTYTGTQFSATSSLVIIVSNGTSIINGRSKSIVAILPVQNATVSGTVAYASTAANAVGGVTVTLTPATGTAMTATSTAAGTYSIAGVPAGAYTLSASKTGGWGGVNATDALAIARHSAGLAVLTGLPLVAGDVNNSGGVNNTDALLVVRRSVGLDASFVGGDWTFQGQSVTVVAGVNQTVNVSGLAVGDVNASYVPASGTVFAKTSAPISLNAGTGEFMITGPQAALGAVSMKLNVNAAKVASISSKLPGFVYTVEGGVVRLGWFAQDGKAVNFDANEAIATVKLENKVSDKNATVTVSSDIADVSGAALDNDLAVSVKVIPAAFALSQNYPNPFNPSTQINYDLPKAGLVTLSVYNMLGQEVSRIVNEQKEAGSYTVTWAPRNLASGVYIYRLHVQTEKDAFTSVKRLTLLK